MPFLDPPEPLRGRHTRLPYRATGVLIAVLTGTFLVGSFLLAAGLEWIAIAALGSGPRWALVLFGATLLAAGILLTARLAESAWLRHLAAKAPPGWPTDYPWPRNGVLSCDQPRLLVFDALGVLVLMPLLALLNTPALIEPAHVPGPVWLFLGLFDLLVLGGVLGLAQRWRDRARGPRVTLALEQLPVAPGGILRGRLQTGTKPVVALQVRGVRERAEWQSMGGDQHLHVRAAVFYRENLPLPAPTAEGCIALRLPDDAPVTQLAHPPTTYWELVVRQENVESAVLLPIYARGAAQHLRECGSPSSRT